MRQLTVENGGQESIVLLLPFLCKWHAEKGKKGYFRIQKHTPEMEHAVVWPRCENGQKMVTQLGDREANVMYTYLRWQSAKLNWKIYIERFQTPMITIRSATCIESLISEHNGFIRVLQMRMGFAWGTCLMNWLTQSAIRLSGVKCRWFFF